MGVGSFHPLIVHFPVVLLAVAPFFYLLGMLTKRREYRISALLLCLGGFAGAVLAAQVFHPHVSGITEAMKETLETHELFADLTILASLLALLAGVLEWRMEKAWAGALCLLLMLVATTFVSVSGHYGATLTHLQDAGKYVKTGH